MISGSVNEGLEAVISLEVRGPAGHQETIAAIVDTGFTDYLTLPRAAVEALGLPFREGVRFILADGTERTLEVFRGEVLWDRQWRGSLVTVTEGAPLVGMALLENSTLRIDVKTGGIVAIGDAEA